MAAFQNHPYDTNVYLSFFGVPAINLLFSDITVKYHKPGQTSLSTRVLTPTDWFELGDGFYTLKWPGPFVDTLGTFFFELDGILFDNFLFFEFDIDPIPLSLFVSPDVCVISGNITDIGAAPATQNIITFRPAVFPLVVGNTIVNSAPIQIVPDQLGNFSVSLIQGQTVIVTVANSGIQAQITVPIASSAFLIDLLPL
jgi:hypothetical protein